ncbi:hypothetical protein [Pigmentibacter ruber]|uniref:hypothetical protein n=1 Tax=Pigmentibacter ruber TaxID=2683196 RepID=UPI00131E22C3|nr:hypothetical protein [Pigmentibacter ruber]
MKKHSLIQTNAIKLTCLTLPLILISCGVGKKEEKNKFSKGEFKSISFSSSNSISGTEQKGYDFSFKMNCDNVNYNHSFEVKNAKKGNIDIPYNTSCRLSLEKFKIGEDEFTKDATYNASETQLTSSSTNKSSVSITANEKHFLYLHAKSSAFLKIVNNNNSLSFYISEFKNDNISTQTSVLTSNESIKIADIQVSQKLDISSFKYTYWRSTTPQPDSTRDRWYAFDTKNILFQEHCKIHINEKGNGNIILGEVIKIQELEKIFTEDKQNCNKFNNFVDLTEAYELYKAGKTLSSMFPDKVYNHNLYKEVFLVFRKLDQTKNNLPQYNVIKLKNKEALDIDSFKEDYTSMKNYLDKILEITAANLADVKIEFNSWKMQLEYIKNAYAGAKESAEHKNTPDLITKFEEKLNEVKKKIDAIENPTSSNP